MQDATLNDSRGRPVVIEKAICLHEEDYGIAWKHMEVGPPAGLPCPALCSAGDPSREAMRGGAGAGGT